MSVTNVSIYHGDGPGHFGIPFNVNIGPCFKPERSMRLCSMARVPVIDVTLILLFSLCPSSLRALPGSAAAAALPSASATQTANPTPPLPAPPPAIAKPDPALEEVAIVATKDALVRVSVKDKTQVELSHEQIDWCAVDNRAQVLWYLATEDVAPSPRAPEQSQDSVMLSLKFIDLREDGAPVTIVPRTKVRTSSPTLMPIIEYADSATLGDELSIFAPTVVLRLRLKAPPKLMVALQCEGDAAWYCFKMESEPLQKPGSSASEWPMNDDIAATMKDLKRMRLQQVEKLAALTQRAGNRKLWRTAAERKLPRVKSASAKSCEADLGDCGTARSLPGTPYWAVSVDSSRGDFAHETQQFYDPVRKRFFDPRQPGLSSPAPLKGEHAIASMLISGSGRHVLMNGEVLSFEKGILFKGERACGWLNAGWSYMHTHP